MSRLPWKSEIDVAVGAVLPAADRAEECEPADAVPLAGGEWLSIEVERVAHGYHLASLGRPGIGPARDSCVRNVSGSGNRTRSQQTSPHL
jgi:hypothetical protein